MEILQIENLSVRYPGAETLALDAVTFSVRAGEFVVICGESGCGKTMTALSAIGLQPQKAKIPQGKILFDGSELRGLNEEQWNQYRGRTPRLSGYPGRSRGPP